MSEQAKQAEQIDIMRLRSLNDDELNSVLNQAPAEGLLGMLVELMSRPPSRGVDRNEKVKAVK